MIERAKIDKIFNFSCVTNFAKFWHTPLPYQTLYNISLRCSTIIVLQASTTEKFNIVKMVTTCHHYDKRYYYWP